MDHLLFAQKFPFSERARDILRELNISADDVSEHVVKKSALIVSRAFSNTPYVFDSLNPTKEVLQSEVTSFPIAKMFVSAMKTSNIIEKFSMFVFKNTFNNLVEDNDAFNLCLKLADDFKLKYRILEEPGFVEIDLIDYLQIFFIDKESKVVNKQVYNGKILLNSNDFARFLSEKAYAKVFSSLPILEKNIPKYILTLAKSIDSQLVVMEKKSFDLKLVGKIEPSFFPPCMLSLYTDQLAGKKLSYSARLALASFLYQLGMSKTELLTLFSKSPDFKKAIAEYHISRIYEKEISAPGCKKLAENGLKVAQCNKSCNYVHPMQFYLAKLRINNRMKNSSQKKEVS
jgi:DNA primase large subunit